MLGDKSKSEGYELGYFAAKHRLTHAQAREIMRKVGTNRQKLDAAAAKLRTGALSRRKDRASD